MKTILRAFAAFAFLASSFPTFAGGASLAFSQALNGSVYAIFSTGSCPGGLVPSQLTTPTVTVSTGQISISSPSDVLTVLSSPCDPVGTPGFMIPASLGNLPDGHYSVTWTYSPQQLAGTFDVASGVLVPTSPNLANPSAVSGYWYWPPFAGSGFNFQMSNSGLLITYFGWDASGNRLWLVSNPGPQSLTLDTPIVVNMMSTTGGTFGYPKATVASWGNLVLNFSSCQSANVSLVGVDGYMNISLNMLSGVAGIPSC